MSFDENALNYFFSSDHKKGTDLEICKNIFKNCSFKRILDIATGAGHFLKIFDGSMKVASDISFEMLKTARNLNKIHTLTQNSAENLPFKQNVFDLITCRIAMHHFEEPEKFFKEVHRTLKPKGLFILIDSITDIEDAYLNVIEYIRDNSHRRSYKTIEILEKTESLFRLLTFKLFQKKHNFQEWAGRINGFDENKITEIEKAFLSLPQIIKEELHIELENNRIKTYTDKKGIFIFQKL